VSGIRKYLSGRAVLHPLAAIFSALFYTSPVQAHVSEQGFVLLLPTGLYIASGVAAVALTILLLVFLPGQKLACIFRFRQFGHTHHPVVPVATSLLSLVFLMALVAIGFLGPRDPLTNLLPLVIWTVWWIAFVVAQGFLGDLWAWLNPWTGFYQLVRDSFRLKPLFSLPEFLGVWPAIAGLLLFFIFSLADLAPDDPARLAGFVLGYWLYTLVGMVVFGGEAWLGRGECFTLLLRHFASLSLFRFEPGETGLRTPGQPLISAAPLSLSGTIFVLLILGSGTFDGLNETFWWLAQIGINPLAFPGRSAVILPTITGLIGANILLIFAFVITLYAGLKLSGEHHGFGQILGRQVLAILPIALGYHAAHFFTSLLVNGQYAIAAISDPLATGADLLGLGEFRVTTGFFNSRDTVEVIWLTQAGFIVAGHILAVLVSHAIATDMYRQSRNAVISQIPVAVFMILYTLIGLTLLASPRGA
jgi:hypothetical protein